MSIPRLPVVLLLMLWLPFHGLAAVAMPFCPQPLHTDAHQPNPAADHAHHHHAAADSPAGRTGAVPGSPSSENPPHLQCEDCGVCHLACAPMLGVTASPVIVAGSQKHAAHTPQLPPAHLLDQPHPPPLA